MTRADLILTLLLAAIAVLLIPMTQVITLPRPGDVVTLTSSYGKTAIDVPWGAGREIDVQGSGGIVVFQETKQGIRAVQSSCEDQLCVEAGVLSAANPIVCAPNGVAAFVVDAYGGFDAVSR